MLLLLSACAPDPDALLHAGRAREAVEAWQAAGGGPIDLAQEAVDALARRGRVDAGVRVRDLAEAGATAALLDGMPARGKRELDLPIDRFADLAACTSTRLAAPWRVAVGRSETPADADPVSGGALPYSGGRIVGAATDAASLAALLASVDRAQPPRLVTLALSDAHGKVYVAWTFRDGQWWGLASDDPGWAAQWLATCASTPPR